MANAKTKGARIALEQELARWVVSDRRVRLFLRDDDATDATPALARLADISALRNIPLLLAAIPKFATAKLAIFLDEQPLITPCVHGYAHTNHAPASEKKMELGDHRALDIVIGELTAGRNKLQEMFGSKLSNLLVPPWNRISEDVARAAVGSGFTGISGFGWQLTNQDQVWVNTHVDIINWKSGKANKSLDVVLTELTTNLAIARENNYAPLGILTHHLVHDDSGWAMLDALFLLLEELAATEWLAADDLVGGNGAGEL
ncbi:MAG: polysaccharide deacetylase [Rhizobiaceae bacterium]|nr:polysaccharide deacetylase [Rhizobiaceae bacterium]